jgi:hypothetical protein
MGAAGINAEYNPFHGGHALQLERLHAALGAIRAWWPCCRETLSSGGRRRAFPSSPGRRRRCAVASPW